MGYMVELNTLLGLPKSFDTSQLHVDKEFVITKERERAFPLNLAVLICDSEWNFYGYGAVKNAVVEKGQTTLTFAVLSLFSDSEKRLYREKFLDAARKTGELPK